VTTFNAAFWKWFGKSKVVDASGKPMVVYHGTATYEAKDEMPFTEFRTTVSQMGIHLGTRKQAEVAASGKHGFEYIFPVYIRLVSPLRLLDEGEFDPSSVALQLQAKGIVSEDFARGVAMEWAAAEWDDDMKEDAIVAVQKAIKDAGYDGIVYLNRYEASGATNKQATSMSEASDAEFLKRFPKARDSYIVFYPEQIKSATDNRGTWSPTDPDIRRNPATGTCYKDALMAVVKDALVGPTQRPLSSYEDLTIVHGQARIKDAETGKPRMGGHAWIEFRAGSFEFVFDPSFGLIGKKDYYGLVNAQAEQRYSQPLKLVGISFKKGHYGPFHKETR